MKNSRRSKNRYRLDLFHALPKTPTWDSLPPPVVRKVSELLSQMLGEHRARNLPSMQAKETTNERED